MKEVGVESAHGFGDCCFNVALIKTLSEHHGCKIGVAVRPHCADAFYNLPWINELIKINDMGQGVPALRTAGYRQVIQITQNIKFFEFKQHDHNHSLINTSLCTGQQLGLTFNHRPIFRPAISEVVCADLIIANAKKPLVAIEAVYKSGQSWADQRAIDMIIDRYRNDYEIVWLSDTRPPSGLTDYRYYSRRELISVLRACDRFFSVGSGFFCACLGLPSHLQPKEIVCLWIDDLYRYEEPLSTLKWHPNIKWVHNHIELQQVL